MTTIEFSIHQPVFVSIKVINRQGEVISELLKEGLQPGHYKTTWDASAFASGLYYYQLHAGNYHETKKLVLLR